MTLAVEGLPFGLHGVLCDFQTRRVAFVNLHGLRALRDFPRPPLQKKTKCCPRKADILDIVGRRFWGGGQKGVKMRAKKGGFGGGFGVVLRQTRLLLHKTLILE